MYLDLLLAWNRTHRLTGLRSSGSIVRGLFQDSLLFLAQLPGHPLAMVDIGSGPGIPGVPLRIVRPEISLTLIESKRKRVSFLSTLKRELELTDVAILEGRAEALVSDHPDLIGKFDVVVSRAVGLDLLPTATRYLKPGGLFVGAGSPAQNARIRIQGAMPAKWETISFPALGLTRTFLLGHKPA